MSLHVHVKMQMWLFIKIKELSCPPLKEKKTSLSHFTFVLCTSYFRYFNKIILPFFQNS